MLKIVTLRFARLATAIAVVVLFQASARAQYIVHTWDPMLRHACYAQRVDPPKWIGVPEGPDCDAALGKRWIFGSTNETAKFSHGGLHDIPLTDPTWKFSFHRKPYGTYKVGW